MKKLISLFLLVIIAISSFAYADSTYDTVFQTPLPSELPVLKKGAKGDDVFTVQNILIQYGYLDGEPTGKLDKNTQKALKDLQINNSLDETGICDEATWELFRSGYICEQFTVFHCKRGKVYHCKPFCGRAKSSKEITFSEALRKGLRPCQRCH